eukprot:11189618-Lingulodinium_polyedra.AAC.1
MCTALATWVHWGTPSAALFQATQRTQAVRAAMPRTVDVATICERRGEAITEMAYAQALFANIPQQFRYQ